MSGVCWCGHCHGCRLASLADYDTADEEAREQAEYEAEELARAEELACYVDGVAVRHSDEK